MNWYLGVLRQYAVFKGRARRKEYWFFILFNLIASRVLTVVDYMTGSLDPELGMGLLSGLYSLAVLIPSLAVTVRRLHDTDHTGWWLLIGLIPLLGAIVLLIFMLQDSKPGDLVQGHMTGFQEPARRPLARCLALALVLCFLGNFTHRFLESTTQGARRLELRPTGASLMPLRIGLLDRHG